MQVTNHCHAAMPNLAPEKLNRSHREQLMVRAPLGTKAELEAFRKSEGFRSVNEAALELFRRGLTAADI